MAQKYPNFSSSSRSTNSSSRSRRVVQNFLLVWLDANVASSSQDTQHALRQLRTVVNDINLFTDPDECVTFLQDIQMEKAFVITSGSFGQTCVPCIHPMAQVDAIFLFCSDERRHEQWTKRWPKVKGVHTRIEPICKALQMAANQCNHDSIAVSFGRLDIGNTPTAYHDQLDPSFMYTQLFKNALLDMQHDEEMVQDLVRYCQDKYADNPTELQLIEEFGRTYRPNNAIWWYTREGFTYQMLNRALRLLEADIIVNMGFFIHDLHQQIQHLHQEQIREFGERPFVVYRGQGMFIADFKKLQKTRGGLISFNSFLSTTANKNSSLGFARRATTNEDMVGLLFIMTIDPKINSTPFAKIQDASCFQVENEILFSMHTVFRIDDVKYLIGENRLFEVQLTLTKDDDPYLRILTERFHEEIRGSSGLDRIGRILLQVGELDKAEELYQSLLVQTPKQTTAALYNQQLGWIKKSQGDYRQALRFYEKALDIDEKTLPANHPSRATSYNNIGLVYSDMGEYSKALSFHEKALDIYQKTLPANHPDLATSYNNIGLVYSDMGEYSKALSFYEANHPSLATSYNNILTVFQMGEYSKALSFYEKALDIDPANHPDLATSYNNIGSVYSKMGEYSKALSFYEKTLDIDQKTLPANHPSLATSYNNIGLVYSDMGEYSKALSFYEKHWTSIRKLFLPIIPLWPLPTTTSAQCIPRWESTQKPCPSTKRHWTSIRKLFLPIIQSSETFVGLLRLSGRSSEKINNQQVQFSVIVIRNRTEKSCAIRLQTGTALELGYISI